MKDNVNEGILEKDCEKCNNKSEKKNLRDAQTSPQKSPLKHSISPKISKKQLLSPSKIDSPPSPHHPRAALEKSNSLGESKPVKQLRTTKSLSPRPPIKHQTSLNDENNVVVKVSPAEDEGSEKNELLTEKQINNKKADKIVESLKLDDWQKNRSTGCLVYVPSDPWTKMDSMSQQQPINDQPQKGKKGSNRMKKLMEVKSLSKPDLIDDNDNDPWVLDEARKSRDKSNKKSATYRHQSKSLHIDTRSTGTARPRLQRSKSPVLIAPLDDVQFSKGPLSPKDPLSSLSPTLGYHSVTDKNSRTKSNNNGRKKQNQQQFLNVSNPNLLQQSRHSFSTSPTTLTGNAKDDELTLNIRRLSEQIKYSSTYGSYGNFHGTSSAVTSPKQIEGMEKSASLLSDSLLETTC